MKIKSETFKETLGILRAAKLNKHEWIKAVLPKLDNIQLITEALVIAASQGHAEAVAVILKDERIDPNAIDSKGDIALRRAVEEGHVAVTKLLANDPRTTLKMLGQELCTNPKTNTFGIEAHLRCAIRNKNNEKTEIKSERAVLSAEQQAEILKEYLASAEQQKAQHSKQLVNESVESKEPALKGRKTTKVTELIKEKIKTAEPAVVLKQTDVKVETKNENQNRTKQNLPKQEQGALLKIGNKLKKKTKNNKIKPNEILRKPKLNFIYQLFANNKIHEQKSEQKAMDNWLALFAEYRKEENITPDEQPIRDLIDPTDKPVTCDMKLTRSAVGLRL